VLRAIEGKPMKIHRKIIFSTFFILSVLLSQALYNLTYSNNGSNFIGIQALLRPIDDVVPARYNVTLWVRDWANKTSYDDVNVTIFDPQGQRSTSYLSNQTGYINLRLIEAGSYVISAQKANRTIGYQEININQNATHIIKTWAYDFNMTLVDKQGNRLANQTVMLYDQLDFDSPKFTYESGTVVKRQNITLITEELGSLVRQAKTDNNGTLSFLAVWNGTYRMKIIGVETEIREYILGELVITKIPPAIGEGIMVFQNPINITLPCLRVDFQLHLVAASNFNVTNAQVYTRDMNGNLFFSDISNKTGYVEHKNVYFINGEFAVTARYGNRTIGYKEIEITESKLFTIKCWMNNLTVTCIDLDSKPLVGYVILLYDQVIFYSPTNVTVVTNQTMQLVNWTKTNENGVARFSNLWNGTYWITVSSGEIVKELIINLQTSDSVIVIGEKTYMSLRFVTRTGLPLSGALVRVYDDSENLVFWEYTDSYGRIQRQSLRLGRYTINVEWMGTQVASQTVNIQTDYGRTIMCEVFSLTLRCVDQFGNALSKADVVLVATSERVRADTDTDETGSLTLLLPQGSYGVTIEHGIFSGSQAINLNSDQNYTINCSIKSMIWISLVLLILPFASFTVILERRKLRTPLEIRRYKNMLSKLEMMYKNGQVEYKIYRKLREEYEARIMELGGREMR
jgi:hypothetical protein